MLATLEGASAKQFTRELSELGAGSFVIARNDPKATDANLALGNLVKYKVQGIYRHAIWIEEPSTVVVSTGEAGRRGRADQGPGRPAPTSSALRSTRPSGLTAAAAFVASASNDNGAGATSLVIATPAGTTAGDVMVAVVTCVGRRRRHARPAGSGSAT